MATDQLSWESRLRDEGFSRIYVWQDGPNTFYPDHTHAVETAHIILDGEMTLKQRGVAHNYGVGERFDVPANTVHSAKMGTNGCKYLIGEK